MKNTTTTLKNPYYFIEKDGTCLYKISNTQDEDNCGVQMVVKNSDGTINNEACAAIFPYIKITYKENTEAEDKSKYLWLSEFIAVGDNFIDGKFVINEAHRPEDGGSYVSVFKQQIGQHIAELIANGYTIDRIKKVMSDYLFVQPGETMYINGKEATLVCVTTSENEGTKYFKAGNKTYYSTGNERSFNDITYFEWKSVEDGTIKYTRSTPQDIKIGEMLYVWFEDAGVEEMIEDTTLIDEVVMTQDMYISNEDILNYFYAYIHENVLDYANRLLKKCNQKIKEDKEDEFAVINSSMIDYRNVCKLTLPEHSSQFTISRTMDGDFENDKIPYGTKVTLAISSVIAGKTAALVVNGVNRGGTYMFNITEDTVVTVEITNTTTDLGTGGNETTQPNNPSNPGREPSNPQDGHGS